MKKYLHWTFVLMMILSLVAIGAIACSDDDEDEGMPSPTQSATVKPTETGTPPTPTPAATIDPNKSVYKLGAVISTSGANAPLGEPEKQTLEMMVEEINNAGGINGHELQISILNDESTATTAVMRVSELIDNNVLAILGSSGSGNSIAMADPVTAAKVPMIALAASSPIVTDNNGNVREWVFMTPQSSNQAARTIFTYLQNDLKIHNVALITDSGAYGKAGLAALEKEITAFSLTVVAKQTFDNTNDIDMTTQLNNIKNASPTPEAIICWGTNPGPARIAKNVADMGLNIPLINSHGSIANKFIELAGASANGVKFVSGKFWIVSELPDSDPQKAVIQNYIADFEAKYGKGNANTYGGHAYDGLSLVKLALEKMPEGLSTAEQRAFIRDTIQTTTGFAGTAGVFNYSPTDHHGLSDANGDLMSMIQIVDGKWMPLK